MAPYAFGLPEHLSAFFQARKGAKRRLRRVNPLRAVKKADTQLSRRWRTVAAAATPRGTGTAWPNLIVAGLMAA